MKKSAIQPGSMSTEKVCVLKPHPLSVKLYGQLQIHRTPHFEDLRDSIKEKGVLVPLLITRDNQIISGHSRWFFAKMFDFQEVPVTVFASNDPLDIEEAIIHANRQRAKTKEQIAREYKHLKKIERERAKARQGKRKDLGESNIPENLPECSEGDARDLAAQQLGISGKTADKMEAVVDAIDEAEESGDTERADDLRETLEKKSASAAHRKATAKEAEPTSPVDYMQQRTARQLDELKRVWGRTGEDARAAFLEWVKQADAA